MQNIYWVYIVQCSDGSYYTGITNDVDRRVWEHNNDPSPTSYTYLKRPVRLVFQEDFPNPQEAIDFEKRIKGWRREKKEALIQGAYERLPGLSRNTKEMLRSFDRLRTGSTQHDN